MNEKVQAKVLGYLAIGKIKNGMYSRSQLRNLMENASLSPDLLPGQSNPADAFRKACTHVASKWRKREDDFGREIRIRITKVVDNKTTSQRNIVQETVKAFEKDGLYRNLFNGEVALLALNKETGQIAVDLNGRTVQEAIDDNVWAPGIRYDEMVKQVTEAKEAFETDFYDATLVRQFVTKFIDQELASHRYMGIRGNYFVPKSHMQKAENFTAALNSIPGIKFTLVKLYDEDNNKENLAESAFDQITAELENLEEEVTAAANLRKDKMARIRREVEHYREMIKSYSTYGLQTVKFARLMSNIENGVNIIEDRQIAAKARSSKT